jgi:hypothetical protein
VVSVSATLAQAVPQKKAIVLLLQKKKGKKISDFLMCVSTYQFVNREESPQCVLCEVFANNNLNARNLHRHLATKHDLLANKPVTFFEQKLLEMQEQLNLMKTEVTTSTKALLASFETSYLTAKNKKPHNIGETLLLLAAIKMCEIMHGENYCQAPTAIPLISNTVIRQIDSISEDIKEQLLTWIKCSPNLHLKFMNQQMLQVYLSYLCLSDTALKKTFRKISCSVNHSQTGQQEAICSRL